MTVFELDTPVVTIDLDRVEHNIAKLQAYCDEHGLKLRPHIKTHKLPLLAHKQLAAGAAGITCQKLGEAEVMAAAGIRDILITYNIMGGRKTLRLARLAKLAAISVGIDNEVALAAVADAAALAERPIDVLIEFESGKERQGVVEPAQALELAKRIAQDRYLRFQGLMSYPTGPRFEDWVDRAQDLFKAQRIPVTTISGGGTPGMWRSHEVSGLSEIRVGTYVYHDRATLSAGSATLDECAMNVHATVVSMPTDSRGVVDAGSKTLSSDLIGREHEEGYGLILEYPEALITSLSEEHGVVDFSRCRERPAVGERVRIVPNHACVVSNLHDEVVAHRGGAIEAFLAVAARGKLR